MNSNGQGVSNRQTIRSVVYGQWKAVVYWERALPNPRISFCPPKSFDTWGVVISWEVSNEAFQRRIGTPSILKNNFTLWMDRRGSWGLQGLQRLPESISGLYVLGTTFFLLSPPFDQQNIIQWFLSPERKMAKKDAPHLTAVLKAFLVNQ